MIEILSHLFVLVVSPIAVGGTALYAVIRKGYFLGTLASVSILMVCAVIALKLFDGYLLAYQLVYTAMFVVPGVLGIAALLSFGHRTVMFVVRRRRSSTG